jgi:hypothetical protein
VNGAAEGVGVVLPERPLCFDAVYGPVPHRVWRIIRCPLHVKAASSATADSAAEARLARGPGAVTGLEPDRSAMAQAEIAAVDIHNHLRETQGRSIAPGN